MKKDKLMRQLPLHIMLIPAIIIVLIFSYLPMAGIVIAFQKFKPVQGLFGPQEWVGFDNFSYVFKLPSFIRVIWNTIYIALLKIITGLIVPISIAVLINEIKNISYKRTMQTMVYLPHFLSWVLLGGILIEVLSPSEGLVNKLLGLISIQPIFFLGSNKWFPITIVATNLWKEFGFSTIVYLAAITSIDPNLYESATIDGANRWKKVWNITIPCISNIIILLSVLSLGNILNAGFDQVFNLYNVQVYESGDIIDTFVYRLGLIEAQFGVATAVGLFKSFVSLIFITTSYYLAYRYADYQIF